MKRLFIGGVVLGVTLWGGSLMVLKSKESTERAAEVARRVSPQLKKELQVKGLVLGQPVFLRIFKEERQLELWVQKEETFERFRSYPIAAMSGQLGPKLAEGDYQAPEGFYFVPASMMNPKSLYHLAFNIGFPNSYDLSHEPVSYTHLTLPTILLV